MNIKDLSNEYPTCRKFNLTFNYHMDVGPYITCYDVEKLLKSLVILNEFQSTKIKDMEKLMRKGLDGEFF